MERIEQKADLYFKDGKSDKEYHIQLVEVPKGFLVNFQYGRRGQSLKQGTKTSSPVDKETAKKIYASLYREKTVGTGYTEVESGKIFSMNTVEERLTSMGLMHLTPISEKQVEIYITDDNWFAQEKHDGERRGVQKTKTTINGVNKKNLSVPLPKEIEESIILEGEYDAEIIGDHLHVFDVLSVGGKDARINSAFERLRFLELIKFGPNVSIVQTAHSTNEKYALFQKLKDGNSEGIVFKRKDARYTAGRGETAFKFKFLKTATFEVANHTKGKSSVGLKMYDGNKEVAVGKVTIPPNKEIPPVGSFVEVQYLYAFPGGAIFHPVYKVQRNDCDKSDCGLSQLVYKKGTEEDEE